MALHVFGCFCTHAFHDIQQKDEEKKNKIEYNCNLYETFKQLFNQDRMQFMCTDLSRSPFALASTQFILTVAII